MLIREATKEDNVALLALTRTCPMDGIIGLLIDRQPDFFSLLHLKGRHKVLVAEVDNQVVGCFALVLKQAYINEAEEQTGYLCDLKIAPAYRNMLVAYRLLRAMYQYMRTLPIDFYLCVTAKGNNLVETLVAGRAGIPAPFKAADFNVYQFLPLRKYKKSPYAVVPYEQQHEAQVLEILNTYYRSYQFASVFDATDNVAGDKAWLIFEQEQLVAFLSVADMDQHKQNVVLRIPVYLKALLSVIRVFWPYIRTTREKEPLKMLYVKYLAFTPQHTKQALALLQQARHDAYVTGYSFLSYGIDSRNSLATQLSRVPNIAFKSKAYVFDLRSSGRWPAGSVCHDNFYKV